jgi:hypothetical protein
VIDDTNYNVVINSLKLFPGPDMSGKIGMSMAHFAPCTSLERIVLNCRDFTLADGSGGARAAGAWYTNLGFLAWQRCCNTSSLPY